MRGDAGITGPGLVGAKEHAPGDVVEIYPGEKVRLGDAVLEFDCTGDDGYARVQLYSESQARHQAERGQAAAAVA